jgi:hypothetical protein
MRELIIRTIIKVSSNLHPWKLTPLHYIGDSILRSLPYPKTMTPEVMTSTTSCGDFNSGLQAGAINVDVTAQFRKL